MLVTALTPLIGYDKAAEVAKKAHKEGKHPTRGERLDSASSRRSSSTRRFDPSR